MVDSDWLYSRGSKQRFDREALVNFIVYRSAGTALCQSAECCPVFWGKKSHRPPSPFLYLPMGE